jgi:curved DNA-binding protein CbpA
MDLIEVDGEYYDPYHILGVTKDDSLEIVKVEYKIKAKKYHPDKARAKDVKKYGLRFRIVKKAYDYIKERKSKVTSSKSISINVNRNNLKQEKQDISERLKNIEDYDKLDTSICNQFLKKKFTPETFNRLFEYNKQCNKQKKEKQDIVKHQTTDGFFGYNSSVINNCALVSSFQGLLLTLDNDNDDDNHIQKYNSCFDGAKNPSHIVCVPKDFEVKPLIKQQTKQDHFTRRTFEQEEKILHDKMLKQLVEKEEYDKKIISKASQYDNETIQRALRGELDMSPSLLNALSEHYKTKKLTL